MSNSNKIINASLSSIADLKAELLRKQEEVRQKKKTTGSNDAIIASSTEIDKTDDMYDLNLHIISKLPKTVSVVDQTVLKRSKQNEIKSDSAFDDDEQEKAIQKSKEMLEKKAQLYDQLAKGSVVVDPETQEELLVNFELKNKNNVRSDDCEELVEYLDEFGRTKFVPRSSLPEKSSSSSNFNHENWSTSNELLSEDMKMEIERRNWEEDIHNELNEKRSLNVHYENVRDGEIRDHGVAFYSFAQDEETRNKQMEMLVNMSNETEQRKKEKQKIKDKRKKLLQDRLAKVAARKGIPIPVPKDDSESEDEVQPITIHKSSSDNTDLKPKVVNLREWDIGKEGVYSSISQSKTYHSQESYQEQNRSKRISDFAPPSSYNEKESKYRKHQNDHKHFKSSNSKENPIEKPEDSHNIASFISEIRKNHPE